MLTTFEVQFQRFKIHNMMSRRNTEIFLEAKLVTTKLICKDFSLHYDVRKTFCVPVKQQ